MRLEARRRRSRSSTRPRQDVRHVDRLTRVRGRHEEQVGLLVLEIEDATERARRTGQLRMRGRILDALSLEPQLAPVAAQAGQELRSGSCARCRLRRDPQHPLASVDGVFLPECSSTGASLSSREAGPASARRLRAALPRREPRSSSRAVARSRSACWRTTSARSPSPAMRPRPETLSRAVEAAVEQYGGLDIVVAAAGGAGTPAAAETDDARWRAAIDSNLTSCFVTCRETLPALLARGGGSIVVVASAAALAAPPSLAGYTAAKTALIGLVRSLAVDYGPQGIRVNAVCPGWVETPMADVEMDKLAAERGVDARGGVRDRDPVLPAAAGRKAGGDRGVLPLPRVPRILVRRPVRCSSRTAAPTPSTWARCPVSARASGARRNREPLRRAADAREEQTPLRSRSGAEARMPEAGRPARAR